MEETRNKRFELQKHKTILRQAKIELHLFSKIAALFKTDLKNISLLTLIYKI